VIHSEIQILRMKFINARKLSVAIFVDNLILRIVDRIAFGLETRIAHPLRVRVFQQQLKRLLGHSDASAMKPKFTAQITLHGLNVVQDLAST